MLELVEPWYLQQVLVRLLALVEHRLVENRLVVAAQWVVADVSE